MIMTRKRSGGVMARRRKQAWYRRRSSEMTANSATRSCGVSGVARIGRHHRIGQQRRQLINRRNASQHQRIVAMALSNIVAM